MPQNISKNDYSNAYSYVKNKIGVNAMTMSNITGIPRATVIRKLNILIRNNFLFMNKKKHYFPVYQIDKTHSFDKQSIINTQKLSVFITKILNLTIVTK